MTQQYIVEQYIFNPNDQTITLPSIPNAKLEGVQLITNLTTGELIYQFNNAALGGSMSGNVLTLNFDSTGMDPSDKLQILYNPPSGGFFDRAMSLLYEIKEYLRSPPNMVPAAAGNYQRVLLDTTSNINGLTTVTNVQNLLTVGGIDTREMVWNLWDTEYNTGIRSKII